MTLSSLSGNTQVPKSKIYLYLSNGIFGEIKTLLEKKDQKSTKVYSINTDVGNRLYKVSREDIHHTDLKAFSTLKHTVLYMDLISLILMCPLSY